MKKIKKSVEKISDFYYNYYIKNLKKESKVNTLEKLLLTLTMTFFSISNLYAQPCIGDNCIAIIGDSKNSSSKTEFVAFNKEIKTEDKELEDDFTMIALDNNIESSTPESVELKDNSTYYSNKDGTYLSEYRDGDIILIDDSENSDTPYTDDIGKLKLAKVLYACEDIINNIVACDNEKKEECECV